MIEIKYKQFVIIPKIPKMSSGKIASQTAHATFMALKKQKIQYQIPGRKLNVYTQIADKWEQNGMCVIVLQCKNELQLNNISKYLEQWNIPHHLYIDEGLYGCKPFTATALATGILTENQFWIFKTMGLFK